MTQSQSQKINEFVAKHNLQLIEGRENISFQMEVDEELVDESIQSAIMVDDEFNMLVVAFITKDKILDVNLNPITIEYLESLGDPRLSLNN
jgi:hypothetical protein